MMFVGSPASALTADLSTTIFSVSATTGSQDAFFTIGETIDIHFEVDDSVVDVAGAGGSRLFEGAILDLTVTFGSGIVLGIGADPTNDVLTLDDIGAGGILLLDNVLLSGNANQSGSIDDVPLFQLTVSITAFGLGAPSLVVDDEIGTPPLAFDQLLITIVTFDNVSAPNATIINAVPESEPASLGLVSLIAGAAWRRRA